MPVLTDADIAKLDGKHTLTDADIDQHAPDATEKPSIVSDALKYSPVGMVKGLADMLRTAASGRNPLAGMAESNAKILDKAKDSFDKGHYAEALGHFINYIAPGGSAMEDISQDLSDGNYGHAAAKFGGLSTSIAAGAKAPAVLDAATQPGLGSEAMSRIKAAGPDLAAGAAKVAGGELLANLPGMEYPARIAMGYPGARQMATGVGKLFKSAPLAEKVGAAASTAATEAADPLLDAIAQGQGYPKGFKSVPNQGQQVIRNLAEGMRNAEAAKSASAASAIDAAPDARASLEPEIVAKVDEIQKSKGAPTIAEQLRDEMLANGSITQQHLEPPVPDSEPSITPEGEAALADTMRNSPSAARIPIAKATYAGGAVDDSELAGAVYEAAHRADRAGKLADVLFRHGVSSEEIPNIAPEHWEALSKGLGLNPPSVKTIAETAAQLGQLENKTALDEAVTRLSGSLAERASLKKLGIKEDASQ